MVFIAAITWGVVRSERRIALPATDGTRIACGGASSSGRGGNAMDLACCLTAIVLPAHTSAQCPTGVGGKRHRHIRKLHARNVICRRCRFFGREARINRTVQPK